MVESTSKSEGDFELFSIGALSENLSKELESKTVTIRFDSKS